MTESARLDVTLSLSTLLRELLDGADPVNAWVLNPDDPGLRSLDKLSAAEASAVPAAGGSSIAAHVDHLRYGRELLNSWSRGENPFADADYSASWRRVTVNDADWAQRRARFRVEARKWHEAIRQPRALTKIESACTHVIQVLRKGEELQFISRTCGSNMIAALALGLTLLLAVTIISLAVSPAWPIRPLHLPSYSFCSLRSDTGSATGCSGVSSCSSMSAMCRFAVSVVFPAT